MALIKIKQVENLQNLSTSVVTNTGDISDLIIVDSALSTDIAGNADDISDLVIVDSALSTNIAGNADDISDLVIVDSALSTSIAALSHTMVEATADQFVSTTAFSFSVPNQFLSGPDKDVLVFINGVKIDGKDYALTTTDITFTGLGYALEPTDEVLVYGRI